MPIVVFIIPCNCCVFCVCAFFFLFHFVFIIRRIVYGVVLTIAAIISILWKCFSVLEIRFSADVARFYALRPFFDYFLIFFTIPAQFYSLFSAFYSFSTQLNFRISFIFVFCKENCVCLYSVYGMTSIALFFSFVYLVFGMILRGFFYFQIATHAFTMKIAVKLIIHANFQRKTFRLLFELYMVTASFVNNKVKWRKKTFQRELRQQQSTTHVQ